MFLAVNRISIISYLNHKGHKDFAKDAKKILSELGENLALLAVNSIIMVTFFNLKGRK